MASRQVLLLAIAVAFLLVPASAEVFMVGDALGWNLNYPATWTDGKTFVVGDSLKFMYRADQHTVVEVGGAGFRACDLTGNNTINTWTSGSDTIALDEAGRRWFVCGVGHHCALGMKLLVTVVDAAAPAPAPESFRCCDDPQGRI